MSLYMRAVLTDWADPAITDLADFVAGQEGGFSVVPIKDWAEFEVRDEHGTTVLAADLELADSAREELDELTEVLEEYDGSDDARQRVETHLANASAVVGLEILMASYDESVAAANLVIGFLERSPGVLTQVDSVGWYDGDDLILREEE